MTTTIFKIQGMTCGHCTSAVEETLGELAGVESVKADLDTGEVTVIHDESVVEGTLTALTEEIGFVLA